jgi:ArsR family transcriptional regulator, arsenate/arsenite/antimonite-responsive transcriptional repressor
MAAATATETSRILPVLGCCTPLTREPMSAEAAQQLATVLRALADPVRLRLLSILQAHQGGEACVCDLVEPLGLSQPTVSHHLRTLLEAGLVTRDKRGVWSYYAVVPGALGVLADLIAPGR